MLPGRFGVEYRWGGHIKSLLPVVGKRKARMGEWSLRIRRGCGYVSIVKLPLIITSLMHVV